MNPLTDEKSSSSSIDLLYCVKPFQITWYKEEGVTELSEAFRSGSCPKLERIYVRAATWSPRDSKYREMLVASLKAGPHREKDARVLT